MPDILIVEDGLHERERLFRLFQEAGFQVTAAESVEEAERLTAHQSYRLAILDIGLGDRSGSHLFERFKRSAGVPYVIILTGNPSVHLKQRFLDEGAAAYIVKASAASSNESLLELVNSLLGAGVAEESLSSIVLEDFLKLYVRSDSRALFLDAGNKIPPCRHCGRNVFKVVFGHKTQIPPQIEGLVVCDNCGCEMDPEVS